jgi:site-specific recombinase XerD
MVNRLKYLEPFERYLIGKNKSKHTTEMYVLVVNQFLTRVNRKFKEKVTKEDIEKFKYWCIKEKKYKQNSLINKYCAINTYLEYIEMPEDFIKKNKLQSPQSIVPNKSPLSIEEVQKIFELSKDNYRNNAIFKVLWYTMIRRSEIVALNLDDVDFERQKLRIGNNEFNPKRNKHQEINIHPDALESIKKYLTVRCPKNPNDKALFLNIYGVRLGENDINLTVKRIGYKAQINKRMYPHLFRISGITYLAQKGLNTEEIKRQSRHSDIKTLLGYIQLSDQEVKDSYMRAMSLDNNRIVNKVNTETKEDLDNIELLLTKQLALGQITQETYNLAIQQIKNKDQQIRGYA